MTTLRHVRTNFVRGLLIVLPAIITFWLLSLPFGVVGDNVTPWVLRRLRAGGVTWMNDRHARFLVPLIGLIAANLVVSGGIVAPEALSARIRRSPRGGRADEAPR